MTQALAPGNLTAAPSRTLSSKSSSCFQRSEVGVAMRKCGSSKSDNGPELKSKPQAHSSRVKISTTCYIKSKVLPVLPRDCPRELCQRSSGSAELLLREEHWASEPDSPSHRENLDAQRREEGVWNSRTDMASLPQ